MTAQAQHNSSPNPLPISVVIAAYNREKMVERALSSVFAQRPRPPAEVIVVDDGSTDETGALSRAMGAHVVQHGENRGAAWARNTGLQAASHPWVALLDSDDEWLPHHLATLWGLREDGHVLVADSALQRNDDDPSDCRYLGPGTRRPVKVTSPATLMYPANFISASSVMIDRRLAISVGGFDTQYRYAEDLDLWLRMLEHGTAVVSGRVAAIYHIHTGQKSLHKHGPRSTKRAIAEAYSGRPWWSQSIIRRRLARDSWDDLRGALRAGRRRDAVKPALHLLSDPRHALAVLEIVRWRRLVRRRSSMLGRDGQPSVALLPGAADFRARLAPELNGRPILDLSQGGLIRAVIHLARSPAGLACVSSGVQAVAVGLLGVHPVRTCDELDRLLFPERFDVAQESRRGSADDALAV
jgi:GT2 family glycosyltransferase